MGDSFVTILSRVVVDRLGARIVRCGRHFVERCAVIALGRSVIMTVLWRRWVTLTVVAWTTRPRVVPVV